MCASYYRGEPENHGIGNSDAEEPEEHGYRKRGGVSKKYKSPSRDLRRSSHMKLLQSGQGKKIKGTVFIDKLAQYPL